MTGPRTLFISARRIAPLAACAAVLVAAPARAQKLDVQYPGASVSAFHGISVSSGFDCDGDGGDDVAIGAPLGGASLEGTVDVYSGATHALLRSLAGSTAADYYGFRVALVGDMDGDGLADVVVGAPLTGSGDGWVEARSVSSGALLWSVAGLHAEFLGSAVASAGDVDKDGIADVLVGGYLLDNAYLLSGRNGAPIHAWHGSQAGAEFGFAVAGGVDVDGDATLDVIIGEPGFSFTFRGSTVTQCGHVTVYSGKNFNPIWDALGPHSFDALGNSVCGLGDVNGDGRAEVLAGSPDSASSDGLVIKFNGTGSKLATLTSASPDEYGAALDRVPDLDADGIPEYAIGAPQTSGAGFVEIRKGSDDSSLWTFTPPDNTYVDYGNAVAGGDVDGDGRGDVVIGDPRRVVGGMADAGDADVWVTVAATATNYGAGFPGTLAIPDLGAPTPPGIGESFTLNVANSLGATTSGLLVVGFSRLNLVTSAGGTLLVAPFELVPLSIPAAGLQLNGSLPNDPSLLGVTVDLQVLELDPGAAHGLSFTPGLELVIGVDYP